MDHVSKGCIWIRDRGRLREKATGTVFLGGIWYVVMYCSRKERGREREGERGRGRERQRERERGREGGSKPSASSSPILFCNPHPPLSPPPQPSISSSTIRSSLPTIKPMIIITIIGVYNLYPISPTNLCISPSTTAPSPVDPASSAVQTLPPHPPKPCHLQPSHKEPAPLLHWGLSRENCSNNLLLLLPGWLAGWLPACLEGDLVGKVIVDIL